MQQLLTGQTRLPGFQGEWEVKSLGELCSLKSGQAITSENMDAHSPYRCFGGNGLRGRTRTYTHEGAYALVGRQGALCGNVVGVEGNERFVALLTRHCPHWQESRRELNALPLSTETWTE